MMLILMYNIMARRVS